MALTPKQQRFCEEMGINVVRFVSKVVTGKEDECWPFVGSVDKCGYGRFHTSLTSGSQILAHRAAFAIEHGYLPEAVCHHCDNPPCCNPAHLFGGTQMDNNRDMAAKGRNKVPRLAARGERHHSAKITNSDASAIRIAYAQGGITQYALAGMYGVSQRTIAKIVTRVSFQNVQ